MSDTAISYWIGWFFGICSAVVFYLIISINNKPVNQEALDNCAKTHNVYQCEMVAVPKTGEK